MSSIVSLATPGSTFDTTIVGENLEIIGQQGEENIIEVKGDSPITIVGGSLEDTITAGAGDASIISGDGDDMLNLIRGGLPGMDSDGNPMGDTIRGGAGEDIFEFAKGEFDSEAVDEIVDFKADGFADLIRIFGVTDGGVTYDSETGLVSINGQEAIDIGTGLDVDINQQGDSDTWELF